MSQNTSGRAGGSLLFIMLVMCTLLHAISVADDYLPAIRKALSLMGIGTN